MDCATHDLVLGEETDVGPPHLQLRRREAVGTSRATRGVEALSIHERPEDLAGDAFTKGFTTTGDRCERPAPGGCCGRWGAGAPHIDVHAG